MINNMNVIYTIIYNPSYWPTTRTHSMAFWHGLVHFPTSFFSQAQGRKDEAQRAYRRGSRIGTRHIQFDGQPHRVGGLEDGQLLMGIGWAV